MYSKSSGYCAVARGYMWFSVHGYAQQVVERISLASKFKKLRLGIHETLTVDIFQGWMLDPRS